MLTIGIPDFRPGVTPAGGIALFDANQSLINNSTINNSITSSIADTDKSLAGKTETVKHTNLNLFSARPDAGPDMRAGRQDATPKPQGGDYDFAPAFALSHLPQSPSALTAGGDCRSNDNSNNNSSKDTNKDNRNMNTSDFKIYSKKEDYNRSTIMGNVSSMGQGDTCELVAANLSAYQDGELDTIQTRLVAAHVGNCPRCAEIFEAIQETDETIQREWRECAPLPSSLHFEQAVNGIMAALPPVPAQPVTFAPRRVHARARWTRFASGMAGVVALAASLWSSYQLGYSRGRSSVVAPAPSRSLSSYLPQSLLLPRFSAHLSSSRLLFAPASLRLTPASLFLPLSSPASHSRLSAAPAALRSVALPRSPLRRSAPCP